MVSRLNSQIMRYARGELKPRVDRREKPSDMPSLMLRLALDDAQIERLTIEAKRARVTVPKFVGDLVRARLTQGDAHATDHCSIGQETRALDG